MRNQIPVDELLKEEFEEECSFRHGAIISLKMANFMCVDHVEYKFHPRLNYVMGPNGSGKSTLVCALYLVMNGDLKRLNRGPNLNAYNNHGRPQHDAKITVKLHRQESGKSPEVSIQRRWNSQGQDSWKIDNRPVRLGEVKELLLSLNARVNNLLQFLPQDKVTEFNSLTDQQRLRAFQEMVF